MNRKHSGPRRPGRRRAPSWARRFGGGEEPQRLPLSQRFWVQAPHPFITRARLRESLLPRPGERILEVGPGPGYYSLETRPGAAAGRPAGHLRPPAGDARPHHAPGRGGGDRQYGRYLGRRAGAPPTATRRSTPPSPRHHPRRGARPAGGDEPADAGGPAGRADRRRGDGSTRTSSRRRCSGSAARRRAWSTSAASARAWGTSTVLGQARSRRSVVPGDAVPDRAGLAVRWPTESGTTSSGPASNTGGLGDACGRCRATSASNGRTTPRCAARRPGRRRRTGAVANGDDDPRRRCRRRAPRARGGLCRSAARRSVDRRPLGEHEVGDRCPEVLHGGER